MALRHAIQHRTTGQYLSAHPALGVMRTDPDPLNAVSFSTPEEAGLYHAELEDFREAWDVVKLEVLLNSEGGVSAPEDVP